MITLQNSSHTGVTILSNTFIDKYMPQAGGEYVKVYIYLLRILSNASGEFSLEQMADHLDCTERDILRALKYWEKKDLAVLSYGSDKKLAGIVLKELPQTREAVPADTAVALAGGSTQAAPATDTVSQAPLGADTVSQAPLAADTVSQAPLAADTVSQISLGAPGLNSPSVSLTPAKPAPKKTLTPERVGELKQNEEIIQLLYIAEQYLGKTLTPSEIQKILFFYDELKMSVDLIDYLIEYCVGRGHKSMRYIETVAMAWHSEGITSVEMAKDASSRHGKEYYAILKAMGISNRNPVDTEVTLMNTWLKEYGFDLNLIQEACSRTVLQTGQPSFQYADKILAGWKKKRVKSMDDIRALDAEHQKRKADKAAAAKAAPKTQNRFNNFHQREYDFDEYEKKLLNQ